MQSNLRLKPKVRWDIIAPSFKMNQTEKQNKELKKQLSPKKYSNVRIKSLFAFVLIALFSLCGETAKADIFSYTYQGKTLYYDIYSYGTSNEVYVYACDTSNSGAVVIPSQVTYGNTTYSVTSIGDSAFYECTKLTNVTIPNSVTKIPWCAFVGCSSLTSITIPNSVTSIGWYAFVGCSSLTSITIPNSVTFIGWCAFYGCSSLTSITIPNSVTSIENYAFYGCSGLESIIVESGNSIFDSRDNCNAIIETSTNTLILGCKNTTIPNSVTSIGDDAFYNCSSLTSITIPNSVTSIKYHAFYGCGGLTSITIPNSVTFIGDDAFSGCSSLDTITINSNNACKKFWGGTYGDTITNPRVLIIGNSVTSIGDGAFNGCSSLINVTIPNSVTSIDWCAFHGCSSLTSVTIPNSVTSIGNHAFSYCSSLTSVTIPNSVTSIGNHAFSYCSSLTSIVIETGNPKYDSRDNCNAIIETTTNSLIVGCKNTIIPNSVTSIGNNAFNGCSSLISITIPNSVTSIGKGAFWGCSSLDTVTINSNSICKKFWGEDNVTNPSVLIIGESVTSISENAFDSCSSLVTIKIPASMTFIERYAFANCTNIDTIYSVGMCPPEVENTTSFKNVSRNAKLFVPSGSIEDYKQAKVWKEFFNIEEYNTSDSTAGIQDIDLSSTISLYPNPADKEVYLTLDNTDLGNAEAVIYDLQGKVVKTFEIKESEKSIKLDVSALQKGTYTIMISNDKTRVTKKLIKR